MGCAEERSLFMMEIQDRLGDSRKRPSWGRGPQRRYFLLTDALRAAVWVC